MNQSILESDPIGSDHSSRSWQMFNAFKCISTQQSMTGIHAMKSCRGYLFNVSQAFGFYLYCLSLCEWILWNARIYFSWSGPEPLFGGTSRYLTLCRSKFTMCYHVLTATRAGPFLSWPWSESFPSRPILTLWLRLALSVRLTRYDLPPGGTLGPQSISVDFLTMVARQWSESFCSRFI